MAHMHGIEWAEVIGTLELILSNNHSNRPILLASDIPVDHTEIAICLHPTRPALHYERPLIPVVVGMGTGLGAVQDGVNDLTVAVNVRVPWLG